MYRYELKTEAVLELTLAELHRCFPFSLVKLGLFLFECNSQCKTHHLTWLEQSEARQNVLQKKLFQWLTWKWPQRKDISDIYKHAVSKGDKYIECQYYEKSAEKKGFIQYKLLRPIVYVLPHHAPMPVVNMINDMKITAQEYLFIADCC